MMIIVDNCLSFTVTCSLFLAVFRILGTVTFLVLQKLDFYSTALWLLNNFLSLENGVNIPYLYSKERVGYESESVTSGTDPRIRICTKTYRIQNTDFCVFWMARIHLWSNALLFLTESEDDTHKAVKDTVTRDIQNLLSPLHETYNKNDFSGNKICSMLLHPHRFSEDYKTNTQTVYER